MRGGRGVAVGFTHESKCIPGVFGAKPIQNRATKQANGDLEES
jgi:hypothetical protein